MNVFTIKLPLTCLLLLLLLLLFQIVQAFHVPNYVHNRNSLNNKLYQVHHQQQARDDDNDVLLPRIHHHMTPLSATTTTVTEHPIDNNSNKEHDGKEVASKKKKKKFTSNPMQVYIEDTDAFGVVFNGNYIKFYERILQNHYSSKDNDNNDGDDDKDKKAKSENGNNNNDNNNTMMITNVTKHKFKSAARLGDEFVIQGEMMEDIKSNNGIYEQTWDIQMIKCDNNSESDNDVNKNRNDHDNNPFVFNTATITLSNRYIVESFSDMTTTPTTTTQESISIEENVMMAEASFPTHYDEFSPLLINQQHEGNNDDNNNNDDSETMKSTASPIIKYYLPFHSMLRYFERVRTNSLGGPEALNRMQVEYGILWVVTSIDDIRIMSKDFMVIQNQMLCQDVRVNSKFTLKRGGMIVICDQELFTEIEGRSILLSSASISICAVDVNKGYRPTKNIPDFVRKLWDKNEIKE